MASVVTSTPRCESSETRDLVKVTTLASQAPVLFPKESRNPTPSSSPIKSHKSHYDLHSWMGNVVLLWTRHHGITLVTFQSGCHVVPGILSPVKWDTVMVAGGMCDCFNLPNRWLYGSSVHDLSDHCRAFPCYIILVWPHLLLRDVP